MGALSLSLLVLVRWGKLVWVDRMRSQGVVAVVRNKGSLVEDV